MKKRGMVCVVLLALMCICTSIPCLAVFTPTEIKAETTAEKSGLVKEKDNYYFYKNGKRVKKTWETIKNKNYYFQADGKAAVGCVKVKGTWYIFNEKGQLCTSTKAKNVKVNDTSYFVTEKGEAFEGWNSAKTSYYKKGQALTGVHVLGNYPKNKVYCFSEKGKYEADMTQKIRSASKYEKEITALKELLGEPKKTENFGPGCYRYQGEYSGEDGEWIYDHIVVAVFVCENGKTYCMGIDAK